VPLKVPFYGLVPLFRRGSTEVENRLTAVAPGVRIWGRSFEARFFSQNVDNAFQFWVITVPAEISLTEQVDNR
jgi:hypothetical protein